MTTHSRPLYVYLQRPDTGEWVTVGRYLADPLTRKGTFLYAPSYIDAGLAWSIDPVNLPFIPGHVFQASRYSGLHDVLRDASPDAWGKLILQRERNIPANAPDVEYLIAAGNGDRWGALAVGTSRRPSVAALQRSRLPQLEALALELVLIAEHRPPGNVQLRRRLIGSPSLGGARPKATIQDGTDFWLAKPFMPTDSADIPYLEHWAHELGAAAGLRFAKTVLHRLSNGRNVVRVLRFDRAGDRRIMAISGASLLQAEYPGAGPEDAARASYPRLAEELRRIGAPAEDWTELFGRMVFNALMGNDDDHPRNHAAIFNHHERRWRLSPAFDVVPNPTYTPDSLAMQVSLGTWEISRAAMLADAMRFGFRAQADAERHFDKLLGRVQEAFLNTADAMPDDSRILLAARLDSNLKKLS